MTYVRSAGLLDDGCGRKEYIATWRVVGGIVRCRERHRRTHCSSANGWLGFETVRVVG